MQMNNAVFFFAPVAELQVFNTAVAKAGSKKNK
jgi:hypothetical protein